MRIATFVACCAALLAAAPLYAQSRAATGAQSEATANARNGVRFVICSPGGATLPSPLYYRVGKEFRTVSIGGRIPSQRIRPIDGKVDFWEDDPSGAADGAKTKGSKATAATKELPKPALSIPVPDSNEKLLCIVVPGENIKKTQTYFLKEKDFPAKGLHIINFSSFPLRMTTSIKGDFSDKQDSNIGVFRRDEGISKNNTWSYVSEEDNSKATVAFMLAYKTKDAKEFQRLRVSRFTVSSKQAQISVIVKDPTRDIPKMLSIQMVEGK